MSVADLAPRSLNVEPAAPRRVGGGFLWYVLIECLTWLFLIGMVGTVSAGASGSSGYTLAVTAAGLGVSFLRRNGTSRQTLFTTIIELGTLFLVVGVASNPARNGLPAVVAALAAWVAIEVIRAALAQPATVIDALGQIVLLVGVGIVVDGRTAGVPALVPALGIWIAAELGWRGLNRRLAARHRPAFRLTRRQKVAVGTLILALIVGLAAQIGVNYTTVLYHDQRVSLVALRDQGVAAYCLTYAWKIGGLNLSSLGLGGPTECFDTEAELRQAAATHEWISRRAFSDELP